MGSGNVLSASCRKKHCSMAPPPIPPTHPHTPVRWPMMFGGQNLKALLLKKAQLVHDCTSKEREETCGTRPNDARALRFHLHASENTAGVSRWKIIDDSTRRVTLHRTVGFMRTRSSAAKCKRLRLTPEILNVQRKHCDLQQLCSNKQFYRLSPPSSSHGMCLTGWCSLSADSRYKWPPGADGTSRLRWNQQQTLCSAVLEKCKGGRIFI